MKNKHGQYILADRVVDAQHNKAANQFFVESDDALFARIRNGGISVRMQGNITRQPNLISAAEIELIEDQDGETENNPFETFSEWSSSDDEKAYRDL